MKLIDYNNDTGEFTLNVRETLSEIDIETLRIVAAKEHGQMPEQEIFSKRWNEETGEEDTKWDNIWRALMELEDIYLIEPRTIGGPGNETRVYAISDIGKLVLKLADKQLKTDGTTYA